MLCPELFLFAMFFIFKLFSCFYKTNVSIRSTITAAIILNSNLNIERYGVLGFWGFGVLGESLET